MNDAQAKLIRRAAGVPAPVLQAGLKFLARRRDAGEHRAKRALSYIDDPERYAREILGSIPWSRRQRRVAERVWAAILAAESCWVLALGGHGTGKTHGVLDTVSAAWGVAGWRPDKNGDPQGCGLILTAPTAGAIEKSAYYGLVERGKAAAAAGLPMPGWEPRRGEAYRGASARSVNWEEGPWRMLAFSPQERAGGDVAHAAGGIHHKHLQIDLIEEAMGVPGGMVKAVEGHTVASGTIVLATTNPTAKAGFLFHHVKRRPDLWHLEAFSQLDHPNVLLRREEIPGSVSHLNLEAALRSSDFEDRGPAATTSVDEQHMDVVYALPPPGAGDKPGPRPDGFPGHPDGEPRVYRGASAHVVGARLGGWLESDPQAALFHAAAIESRMAQGVRMPDGPPAQVGVDCHPSRPPWACPRWGPPARAAFDAEGADDRARIARLSPEDQEKLRGLATESGNAMLTTVVDNAIKTPRGEAIHIGAPREIDWQGSDNIARGRCAAQHLIRLYGVAPAYFFDQAAAGEVAVHLDNAGAVVETVPFGDSPVAEPLPSVGRVLNRRAEMAVHLAAVLNSGLALAEYSPRLLDQMRLTGALVTAAGRAEAKKLSEKAGMGDPMDALDAAMLAVEAAPPPLRGVQTIRLRRR